MTSGRRSLPSRLSDWMAKVVEDCRMSNSVVNLDSDTDSEGDELASIGKGNDRPAGIISVEFSP